jgi:hypothetical protein
MQKSKGFGTGAGYGRFLLKLGARVAYQEPVLKAAAHLRAILILFRFGFLSARSELIHSRFRHRLSASGNLSIGLR